MNKLLTDRVKLIRALQGCAYSQHLYCRTEDFLRDIIKLIRADHKSFLSLSQDKDGRVSYSTKPGTKLDNKRRIRTSFGRYLRRQLKINHDTMTDKDVAWIQSQIFARTADISGSVVLICGEEIREVYDSGFGGYTCMSGEDYGKYTQLYADNPDVVAMIKFDNGARARALLWTTEDGAKVLDRIYPDDGGGHITAIRLWAEKQGYIIRGCNHLPEGDTISLSDDSERQVVLRDSGVYPYLDTFCFGVVKKGRVHLSNVKKDGDHTFQGTDGKWLEGFECRDCGDEVGGGSIYSRDGENYCEGCFNERFFFCVWCEEYHDVDSMVHCSESSEDYCDECADKELFRCHRCEEWYKNGITAADTGNRYCKECADDKLTFCEECEYFYEKPMEEIKNCLYCSECAASLKQKDLFRNRRKSKKAAVPV